jgi:hypothetical protein
VDRELVMWLPVRKKAMTLVLRRPAIVARKRCGEAELGHNGVVPRRGVVARQLGGARDEERKWGASSPRGRGRRRGGGVRLGSAHGAQNAEHSGEGGPKHHVDRGTSGARQRQGRS